MKVPVAFCFAVLVTITVTQLYASEVISKSGNQEIKTENGTDIRVTEPEVMEVVVSNNNLTFEICTMKCNADFLVCYESDPPEQNTTEYVDDICDPLCGFYVTGDLKMTESGFVRYMSPARSQLLRKEKCDVATMSLNKFLFRDGNNQYPSCKPKIEKGLVKLNVTRASSDCPITIKNAHFKRDPPTTTVLPSNNGPNKTDSPSGTSSSKVFGIFGWFFAFILLYVLQL